LALGLQFLHAEYKVKKEQAMLGWMIVFGLISVLGGISAITGANPAISMKLTSLLFASLFFLGLLTYAIRGRAR
jgi:hypothetical protein